MLHRILIPTILLTASAFATDISNIPFKTAEGKETRLSAYSGKVILLVNVASKCGFTKQYTGLQKLYEDHREKGLVIIGFPCNNFGGQEPGTIAEIQDFCSTKFNVTFPIMDKIDVKGENQHPLYTALTGKDGAFPGDIKWNFGKILIGKDGKPLARFDSSTKPESKELADAIIAALGR
jgi:glutathione peroxidase